PIEEINRRADELFAAWGGRERLDAVLPLPRNLEQPCSSPIPLSPAGLFIRGRSRSSNRSSNKGACRAGSRRPGMLTYSERRYVVGRLIDRTAILDCRVSENRYGTK